MALLFIADVAVCQTPLLESSHKEIWLDGLIGIENSGLVNGQEYQMAFQSVTSHPFFLQRDPIPGMVVYQSQRFENVPILYDLYQNQVVIARRRSDGLFDLIQLDRNSVDSFRIAGHKFIRSGEGSDLRFYDLLFAGKRVTLLCNRTKVNQIKGQGNVEYVGSDRYYLSESGRSKPVNSASALLDLTDRKKDLQRFIKDSHIKFRRLTDEPLIRTAEFLDTILKHD